MSQRLYRLIHGSINRTSHSINKLHFDHMLRLYLDKQIISYLRKPIVGQEDLYKDLLDILTKYKDKIILFYTVGHFTDLKRDLTNFKDIELNFMAEIGFSHFMRYSPRSNKVHITKEHPYIAYQPGRFDVELNYKTMKESPSFSFSNHNINMLYKRYKKMLITVESGKSKDLSVEDLAGFQKVKENIRYNSRDLTLRKFVKGFHKMHEKQIEGNPNKEKDYLNKFINSAKSTYLSFKPEQYLNFTKGTLKDDLHNSELQSYFFNHFIELMRILGYTDIEDERVQNRDFFASCYYILEFGGIINEQPKKVNPKSMMSDSLHAYFGSFCDVIVTQDKKLYQKSKLLYGLLYINTLVLEVDEFLNFFKSFLDSDVHDKEQIFWFSNQEVDNYVREEFNLHGNYSNQCFIESQWRYLGFFNNIQCIFKNSVRVLVLSRITNNYQNLWASIEIETIVNTAIETFGEDDNRLKYFDPKIEVLAINENRWRGRTWHLNNQIIRLVANNNDFRHVLLEIRHI